MPPAAVRHPASFRDTSGYVFTHDNQLYRQVNEVYRRHYDHLIASGLYQMLTEKGWLVKHTEIAQNLTGEAAAYKIIQPQFIPFISYPYEWCFDMLKDAALLTLNIAAAALEKGMMLKDASAYNVQYYNGKVIFIDTLSFEVYDETKPWIAYRQFCEHFLAPLVAAHYLQHPVQQFLAAYPDGVPLTLAAKLLPFRFRFNLHHYLHLHLNAALQKSESKKLTVENKNLNFPPAKMKRLLSSLKTAVSSCQFLQKTSIWSDYYSEAETRSGYIDAKTKVVEEWVYTTNAKTALDAGANEGLFSTLLVKKRIFTIAVDGDPYAVNQLYKKAKQDSVSLIHPLIVNLTNPSAALGWNNEEHLSFLKRTKVDLVLALALIHHLCIGKNISFLQVAELFHTVGQFLIIEFVPKTDEKVQLMLSYKKDIYGDYTEEKFVKDFSAFFKIKEKQIITSGRTLYFMERNNVAR